MGCNTCKKKKNEGGLGNIGEGIEEINIIPESIQNGDFRGKLVFKIIGFLIILLAWPLISLIIFYVVFVNFFIPKKAGKEVLSDTVSSVAMKYAKFKAKRVARKREKEFKKNRGYEGDSELLNVEVFESGDNNVDDSEE